MRLTLIIACWATLIAFPQTLHGADDTAGIDAWFVQYDALSKAGKVDAMADMAAFPLQVVTTDSKGEGHAETWTRARFIEVMTAATKDTPKDLQVKAKRQTFFLAPELVTVITDATYVSGRQSVTMRYADILVKKNGKWLFQTMAQGGWGDLLKGGKP